MFSREKVVREVMPETGTSPSDLLRVTGDHVEIVRHPVKRNLGRSPERSWRLHRQLAMHLNPETLTEWRPKVLRNLLRLRENTQGHPHLRNLDRWQRLIEDGDPATLRRLMTGRDVDSVEMREVSPMGGLLSQEERSKALRMVA